MGRTRREFLIRAGTLLIAVPAGVSLLGAMGCGDASETGKDCGNAGKLTAGGSTLTFTSSCDVQHTHEFSLMVGELSASAAITRDTSDDDHHTHSVALTIEELARIESGMTVLKTTSSVFDHTHSYAFKKA